ncbi:hypothetical protein AB0M12_42255 [Nocardia vinacea]|uniref:hypothetical protein n=1 Tax=Nocardia vinacea TaxID=96468 RepID=UPI0034190811
MPFMPNSKQPQRDPLVGPPRPYSGAPAETVELLADALREWDPSERAALHGLPPMNHDRVPVMTIDLAHVVMQEHIDCPVVICRVKQQAKARLVEAHLLVPADAPHVGS